MTATCVRIVVSLVALVGALVLATGVADSAISGRGVRYVAIGDSISRGLWLDRPNLHLGDSCGRGIGRVRFSWFDHPAKAYPALVRQALERSPWFGPVRLDTELTCSGALSSQWWHDGRPDPELVRVLERDRPNLITVTLGANDVLGPCGLFVPFRWFVPSRIACPRSITEPAIRHARTNLSGLLRYLRLQTDALIVVTTYYDGDGSSFVRDRFTRPLDAAIEAAAWPLSRVRVVDLASLFAGHDCTKLGRSWVTRRDTCLHPNPEGQREIAGAITSVVVGNAR